MDINRIIYRNANIKDIADIMHIEHASFHHTICESEAVFIERINTFPEGFRIMEYEGELIGYICSEIWKNDDLYSNKLFTLGHSIKEQHNSNGNEIYISSMGLLKQYRSQGLGKLMFKEFIRYSSGAFRNIQSIILIVSEKWINARSIYISEGFEEIFKVKQFFSYKGKEPYCEHGIVMRKHIM